MKKIVLVLGIAALLFAAFNPTSVSAQSNAASYYVRANGNDSNNGTTEATPFKTLAKAITEASRTNVKKITVIGKLDGETIIKDSGTAEILITGKANASNSEKAVLTTSTETNTIQITGNSNIKLEYLTLNTGSNMAIIFANGNNVKLTLGRNSVVSGNGKDVEIFANYGGGILMVKGTLIMLDNATVTNCKAHRGGGIAIPENVKMIMQDNAVISNNYANIAGGGVYVGDNATLELHNNAVIKGNTAYQDSFESGGAGIYAFGGTIKLQDNSNVIGNTAPHGGGITMRMSSMQTADGVKIESSGVYESRQVSGNTATTKDPFFKEMPHNIYVMNH